MSQRQCAPLLTRLVDQHYGPLYRYAYRLSGSSAEAEDLTQQTFLAAAVKWDQLRRGTVTGIETLAAVSPR